MATLRRATIAVALIAPSVQAGIAVSLVAVMAAAAYGWRASRGPQRA